MDSSESQSEFIALINDFTRGTIQIGELYSYMRDKSINPSQHTGKDGYTALHICALNSMTSLVKFLIRYVHEFFPEQSDNIIKTWINQPSTEGFTCIQLAAFRGNTKLVKFLLRFGANTKTLTSQGMNVMHVAAQGDQMNMLVLFGSMGINYNLRDKKGSTPLHLAANQGCEVALSVLLSWSAEVNVADDEGQTPLHLATISGNARCVRNLLLKGANPNLKNKKGQIPIMIAKELNHGTIISLLKEPGLLSICGIRPPQRPVKYRRALLWIFFGLLVFGAAGNIVFICKSNYYMVISGMEFIFLLIIWIKNPGYLKNTKENSLLALCEDYENYQICVECVIKRPPRSRHCLNCGVCVEKFDHHCPWINNCIGARNLGLFYLFLVMTLIVLTSNAILDIYSFLSSDYIFIIETPLLFQQVVSITLLAISSSFLIPVLLLFIVQTRNFWTNTTTNERYSRSTRIELTLDRQDSDSMVNRSSVLTNWKEMCCNSDQKLLAGVAYELNEPMDNEIRFTWVAKEHEKALKKPLLDK